MPMMISEPLGRLHPMSGDLCVAANSTLVKQEGTTSRCAEGGPARRVHSSEIGTHSEPGGPARHSLGPLSRGLRASAFAEIDLALANPSYSLALSRSPLHLARRALVLDRLFAQTPRKVSVPSRIGLQSRKTGKLFIIDRVEDRFHSKPSTTDNGKTR